MRQTMILLAALALAACARSGAYPEEYGRNFVASCRAQGATQAQCWCLWEKIEADVPREEFEAFDRAASAGQPHPLSERMADFTEQCRTP